MPGLKKIKKIKKNKKGETLFYWRNGNSNISL